MQVIRRLNHAHRVAPECAAVDICRIAARIDRTDQIVAVYIGVAARVRGLDRAAVHGKRTAAPQQHSGVFVELHDLAAAHAVLNGQCTVPLHTEHSVILAGVSVFRGALGHCFAVQIQRDIAACQHDTLVVGFIQRHILQHRHRAAGVFFRRRERRRQRGILLVLVFGLVGAGGIRRRLERRRQRGILLAVVLGLVGAGGHHGNAVLAVLPALHRRVLPHRIGGVGRGFLRLALRRDQLGPCRRRQHAEHHHKAHEQTDDPSLHLSSSPSISFQVFYC